jgi:hypothetical protein
MLSLFLIFGFADTFDKKFEEKSVYEENFKILKQNMKLEFTETKNPEIVKVEGVITGSILIKKFQKANDIFFKIEDIKVKNTLLTRDCDFKCIMSCMFPKNQNLNKDFSTKEFRVYAYFIKSSSPDYKTIEKVILENYNKKVTDHGIHLVDYFFDK